MGLTSRGRVNLNRKRLSIRKYLNIKNAIIITSITLVGVLSVSAISMIMLNKKVANATVVYKAEEEKENAINNGLPDETVPVTNNEENESQNEKENIVREDTKEVSICLLGETMLGGEVTKNVEYIYSQAFKDIFSLTKEADFTYTNFSTNITNFDTIEDVKSKYLVTRQAINGLTALGVDSVSIASDHIVDYPADIIKNTVSTLEENDIFVAGRKDLPVYFEKGNKKIAVISTNSVIVGTSKAYKDNDISIYDYDNLKKNIDEAKHAADFVIVDVHWGRDHTYGLTDSMRQIATSAIDLGADLVVGTHALGVYPIVEYKSKPIIYSLGSLISDTDYNVGKEGYIFNVTINENNSIKNIEMIPTYIADKKIVKLYNEYDSVKCNSYLEQFNKWQIENGLNSQIIDNKIVVGF